MRWCLLALTPTAALAAPVNVPTTFRVLDELGGQVPGPLSTTPSLWTDATSTQLGDRVWTGNLTTVELNHGVGTLVLGGDGQPALDSSVLHADSLWLDIGNGIARQPVLAGGVARVTEEVAWLYVSPMHRGPPEDWWRLVCGPW